MKIKNLSGKIIGIGLVAVLPGETQELPTGFEGNPVIAGFQEKGLVELIDEPQEDPAKAAAKAEARAKAEAEEKAKAEAEAAKAKAEAEKKAKAEK